VPIFSSGCFFLSVLPAIGFWPVNNRFGPCVTIAGARNELKFAVDGDIGAGNLTFTSTADVEILLSEFGVPVKQDYSMRHLLLFTKATSLSAKVYLFMTKNVCRSNLLWSIT